MKMQVSSYGLFCCILGIFLTLVFVNGCNKSDSTPKFTVIYNNELQAKHATQSEESVRAKKYKVAFVSKIAGIPYFDVAEDGAKEAAKDLGIELISSGPQVADAEHQIEIVEQLIREGVDAIAIAANDPKALIPVLQKAKKQGIQVITWDSDTLPEARSFFVNQVDYEAFGRHQMDLLATLLNERGSFAILTSSTTAMNLSEWTKWIRKQLDEYYPKMKLVEIRSNNEDMEEGYKLSLDMLDRYPDIKGIIGVGSTSPPAAAKAVQERGKTGEVKVIGIASPNLMRKYLKEGVSQVISLWSPKKLGYLTVYMVKQLLDGEMAYDGQEIPNVGNIRIKGDVVIMGEPIDFTKDNVDDYDF
ncbi:rhamnose ABC transporter substrate-binding protein [Paenibacillus baekrokdamisoli]|uniref:Rhamnose ABC transporter substrate-binding protein n=1 Tax=Paenibacillus baekrokdamisoli TaxID=1712516 RepID=A0A3G9ISM9_9BACL|nr:autoinducer 2 ABC transporter substrate-binding protein [Paenibacillus baekrokdamisoli]MBB3067793.1 rhamnose transport system substrate-binding protein [Paenibacillus baekrokdamisoli]BBH19025.1 rhamnose ABC transporter substrate-binding protein [Paenibacillus baekrokdamisoli]